MISEIQTQAMQMPPQKHSLGLPAARLQGVSAKAMAVSGLSKISTSQ